MKFLVTVDATEWCGYNEIYTVEAEKESDVNLDSYIYEYADSMGLIQCVGGWTEMENTDEDGFLTDEDDVTSFSVTIREYDL